MARIKFALSMLTARLDRERRLCPYCESRHSMLLQTKWLIIQARKCHYCGLIFRWPTDRETKTREFYESDYEGQQATDIPDRTILSHLLERNFRDTQYDKAHRVQFLVTLGLSQGTLLDFGCSWGYSVSQYARMGFHAAGYEIDRNRARFGKENLGLPLYSTTDDLGKLGKFDLILADHSLEHMPDPGEGLRLFEKLVSDNGYLVIFVPNGACRDARRRGVGVNGGAYIGEPHTVAFTPDWFVRNLPRHAFIPRFYTPQGQRLPGDDYLADQAEIALVADRIK